ncbi:MAG: hypothetical protein KY461_05135, partial [Actinobacteria bacterium]|nr:hypothetical protein [Actinomycetota bacterium]
MGIFDRFRQRLRDRPAQSDAPGLFTARSGAVPPELGGTPGGGTAADDDLWNRPAPAREPAPEPTTEDPEVEDPEVEDPEVEAL